MRTNKYGCSLIFFFFLSVYMHTAVLLDNACLENLSSNLLVIYDAHIKPHTCVKELSFQLNWNWEPPWSLGCLCCWKSWSLPHYLKEGKKAQCPNRIKQTVEQSSLVMQKHWLIPASVKMWVQQNYVSFFWPLPVEVSTADHPLPSQLIPCIFLSHQPSPCPPGCCIFDTLCPIYPLSPPLRMPKLSQPCLSFFVSKLHDPSCPSDILLSNLIHSGHPHWENLNMSSSAIHT